jgi:hypothetical protein
MLHWMPSIVLLTMKEVSDDEAIVYGPEKSSSQDKVFV